MSETTSTRNLDMVIRLKNAKEAQQEVEKLSASGQKLSKTMVGASGLVPNIQSSNMHLMSMSRIVQDMPFGFMAVGNNITFMAEQMAMAKAQGASTIGIFKGMAQSLMGTGGVIFAISTITSLLTYYSLSMRSGAGATDEFSKSIQTAIDKLVEFQDPFKKIKFQFNPEQIEKAISTLDKEIAKLEETSRKRQIDIGISSGVSKEAFNAGTFLKQITKEEKNRNKENELLLEKFKNMKAEYEAQIRLAKILKEVGGTEVNAGLGNLMNQGTQRFFESTKSINGFDLIQKKESSKWQRWDIPKIGERGDEGLLSKAGDQLRQEMWLTETLIKDASNVLRSEFDSAFEDIFGNANSLFEKLIQQWASSLATKGMNSLFDTLLSFIPGGNFLSGLLSGGASAAR